MPSKAAKSDGQIPRKVVVVAYEGANLMDISGPLQAFSDARFGNGRPAYQVTLASEAGGPVVTDTGVKLEPARLDRTVSSVDTLLVAGGDLKSPPVSTGPVGSAPSAPGHSFSPSSVSWIAARRQRTGPSAAGPSASTRPSTSSPTRFLSSRAISGHLPVYLPGSTWRWR